MCLHARNIPERDRATFEAFVDALEPGPLKETMTVLYNALGAGANVCLADLSGPEAQPEAHASPPPQLGGPFYLN